jgi:hypothetical protein
MFSQGIQLTIKYEGQIIMFENNNNKENNNDKKIQIRANTLDEGMHTFGQWLYSKDDNQRWDNRLVLKQFVTSSHAVLQDNTAGIGIDIVVDISNGIPICRNCRSDDCAHVGFTICAKQMNTHHGTMDFQR